MKFADFAPSWTPNLVNWSTRRYAGPATLGFSPDGAVLYRVSNQSGQHEVWASALDGSRERRLTDMGDRAARWFVVAPDGTLVLAADRFGDEDHQLYRLAPDGRLDPLVVREGVQHHLRARSLSRDGRVLAYSANLRRKADVEVVVRDLRSGEEKVVLGGDAWHVVGDWSPDARSLLASRVDDNTNQDLLLVDLRSGEVANLTEHRGDETNVPVGFSADGSAIYFVTDRGHDFDWLARMDLRTRAVTPVAKQAWDVMAARLDRGATALAWLANEDGVSTLHGRDLRAERALALPSLPRGYANDLTVFDGGARAALTFTTSTRPWHVLVSSERGWTTVGAGKIAFGGPLAEDERARIPGSAGAIPAFVYRPRGAGRHPAVLWVHGGPEDQEHPRYLAAWQYLVARGVGVVVTNVRGSTGYGKAWQRAIHRRWGEVDLADLDAIARWMRAQPWIDPARMGIYGGSYGGFATLTAVTRLPEYWRAAAEAFGPSDLTSFIRTGAPSWTRFQKRWVGDPDTEGDRLLANSPITHAASLRCPLFVLQGTRDPRVPKSESDNVVAKLRSLGKDVRYVVQQNVGHGWTRTDRQWEAYQLITDYLVDHLTEGMTT